MVTKLIMRLAIKVSLILFLNLVFHEANLFAQREAETGIVIGQRKNSLQKAFQTANHVAEFVVRANKFA